MRRRPGVKRRARRPIGIMSAMQEEMESLLAELNRAKVSKHGMRSYHQGELWGVPVVLVFSRWGKVAAASTASDLISRFGVTRVLFTGVAGAVAPELSIGDVVVGTRLVQHDMDARPLFERHEIPLLGRSDFAIAEKDAEKLAEAASAFVETELHDVVPRPKVVTGGIASGDQFFSDSKAIEELRNRCTGIQCVEMEGAAVAQVCHEHGVPFLIVRTISDSANEHAPIHFPKFVKEIASRYSHGIVRRYLKRR